MHLQAENYYRFECFDRDGNLKWVEEIANLVTNEGLNDILDKYFKGSAYSASWFVGLIDNASFTSIAAGDTAAGISLNAAGGNAWQEFDEYASATRPALTLGSVASQSVDNSASKASYSINAAGTVNGAFVVNNSTKGANAGGTDKLYGAGSFSSTRTVANGDTLNVTITLTSASA